MDIHSLLNLSLHDFQTADYMEVDSDHSIETIQIETSTPIKEKPEEPDIDIEDTSFVSALSNTLLSPTNIGAKYAMRLLPAPEIQEVDNSRTLIKTGSTRHINLFSSSDNSIFLKDDTEPEFVYNPAKKDYDESCNSVAINSAIDNSMNLYRRYNSSFNETPSSIQVHHHHYYYSPGKNDEFVSANNTLTEVTLPPPWKQESTPKEKYSYVILTYLQLSINFGVSIYGIYLLYSIISTIRRDIDVKLSQQATNLLLEIQNCKQKYYDNNCSPELIVPALEKPCNYWLKCMNQDIDIGNKSSISAETLGLILNSLIEPLGFKFFLITFAFVALIFGLNFTFGFIRAKTYYGDVPK